MEAFVDIFNLMEGEEIGASSVAEDVTFELFKYSHFHDESFKKWRNESLGTWTKTVTDLLGHLKREKEMEAEQEPPNILDLSSHPENLNINPDKELAELLQRS